MTTGEGLFVRRTLPRGHRQYVGDALGGYVSTQSPAEIYRYALATGKTEPWRTISPRDPVGVVHIDNVLITPDGKSYVYSEGGWTGDLFLVEGLH